MEVALPLENQELLVRGLAHRMNNILTVFHGYVGLMLDNDSLDPSTRDGLSRIKAGARAATELMDRTHSLVRKPALVWREIDLAEFLHNLQPALETLCPAQTTLTIDSAEGLPRAWADFGRLRSAVLELVRNAGEATALLPASGAVRLTLALLPTAEPAGDPTVSLAVVDNGPGIAPEVATKMFQPFFSTKRKSDATGLGLNVTQGLIQECGGSLRYETSPGRTCFEILLRSRKLEPKAQTRD